MAAVSIFTPIIGRLLLERLHDTGADAALDGDRVKLIGRLPSEDLTADVFENMPALVAFLRTRPTVQAIPNETGTEH